MNFRQKTDKMENEKGVIKFKLQRDHDSDDEIPANKDEVEADEELARIQNLYKKDPKMAMDCVRANLVEFFRAKELAKIRSNENDELKADLAEYKENLETNLQNFKKQKEQFDEQGQELRKAGIAAKVTEAKANQAIAEIEGKYKKLEKQRNREKRLTDEEIQKREKEMENLRKNLSKKNEEVKRVSEEINKKREIQTEAEINKAEILKISEKNGILENQLEKKKESDKQKGKEIEKLIEENSRLLRLLKSSQSTMVFEQKVEAYLECNICCELVSIL